MAPLMPDDLPVVTPSTPPIDIHLDAQGRVDQVVVHRLDDEDRTPPALAAAVRRAHTRAITGPGTDVETASDLPARPRASGPGPRPAPPPYGRATPTAVRAMLERAGQRPARERVFGRRTHVGLSHNECVEVRVTGAVGLATLEVEPSWLRQATRAQVEAALNEAYEQLRGTAPMTDSIEEARA